MAPQTTICHLPNEILSEIVSHLPVYYNQRVVDSSHVASFSLASRRMRAVSMMHLYHEVTITSIPQLHCFSVDACSQNSTLFVRELNIFMDEMFLDAWMASSRPDYPVDQCSPFRSLANILARTTRLSALRIRVAEPSGGRTAWRKFGLTRADGVDFGSAFRAAWPRPTLESALPDLRILELDGFQGVQPLLCMAPHLKSLRLAISAGFSRAVNDELVQALRFVPELRHFAYSPDTLGLLESSSSVDMLYALGDTLPLLETLDLQTRYHRHSIYLCSSSEPLVQSELIAALVTMPNLVSVALPSSTMSVKDFRTLRTPIPISTPESALEQLPALREAMKARDASLSHIKAAERETVERAARASKNLREVIFSRNVEADDRMEYSVRYEVTRRAPLKSRTRSFNPVAVSLKPEVLTAATLEACAPLLPPPPPMSLALTLKQLWAAPPASRRVLTLAAAWAMIPDFPGDVFRVNYLVHDMAKESPKNEEL